jgi:4-amino-4-deoxy-L-arabinose transferase-like glycosyltransferase
VQMPGQRSLMLVLFVVGAVYFGTAAQFAIVDDGDALYANAAQEMLRRGDWVTPYPNGVRFLDKPPLLYWLMAASYVVFGMNEFAARVPIVLAVLGVVVLLHRMGRRAGSEMSGLLGGLVFALCVGTYLLSRLVFPDLLFVFFLTLSVSSYLEWYLDDHRRALPALLFYAGLAGAVMSKGLIGLVFPVATALLHTLWTREWRDLRYSHAGKGALLFLALTVPWHLLAQSRNPGFLYHYFVEEHLLRFLGRREPFDYHSISLPVFWALILVWLFPWSAFFPALRYLRYKAGTPRPLLTLTRICLIWVGVVLAFFSVSSRIEHYILPAFPPLALLIGILVGREQRKDAEQEARLERALGRSFAFLAALGCVLLLGGIAVHLAVRFGALANFEFHPGAARADTAYQSYFASLIDFPTDVLGRLLVLAWLTASITGAGLVCAWWIRRRGHRLGAFLGLAATAVAFCILAFASLRDSEDVISSRRFGRLLAQVARPDDTLVVIGDYETANSINFYAPVQIRVFGGTALVLDWGLRFADAPRVVLSRSDLEERWMSSERCYLLVPDARKSDLSLELSHPLYQSAGRTLYCNQ